MVNGCTMITSIPSLLRLRLLSLRSDLALTEIQLVDDVALYQRIDGRYHIPIEVRAIRPAATHLARFRLGLDESRFWLWPSRWPGMPDGFMGEFAIAVEWAGRAAVSPARLAWRRTSMPSSTR